MIFRKLLCGGFGILMSQNDQVGKNGAFQCCAKMNCKSLQSPIELFWTAKNRTSDRMSDRMLDRMSDRMSDRLSDRISLDTWEYHF